MQLPHSLTDLSFICARSLSLSLSSIFNLQRKEEEERAAAAAAASTSHSRRASQRRRSSARASAAMDAAMSGSANLDDLVSVLTTGDFTEALTPRRREKGQGAPASCPCLCLSVCVCVSVCCCCPNQHCAVMSNANVVSPDALFTGASPIRRPRRKR